MSQSEMPQWLSFQFHPQVFDKEHRDSCVSCQVAVAGMGMYVDMIRSSEEKENDE